MERIQRAVVSEGSLSRPGGREGGGLAGLLRAWAMGASCVMGTHSSRVFNLWVLQFPQT